MGIAFWNSTASYCGKVGYNSKICGSATYAAAPALALNIEPHQRCRAYGEGCGTAAKAASWVLNELFVGLLPTLGILVPLRLRDR